MEDPDETDSVLSYIPLEGLWLWVDEDVENRAWYLASFAPKNLIGIESRPSLFREILIRYGDREDVRGNLRANYLSGG